MFKHELIGDERTFCCNRLVVDRDPHVAILLNRVILVQQVVGVLWVEPVGDCDAPGR